MGSLVVQASRLQERLQANRKEYQAIQDNPAQSKPESLEQTTAETKTLGKFFVSGFLQRRHQAVVRVNALRLSMDRFQKARDELTL